MSSLVSSGSCSICLLWLVVRAPYVLHWLCFNSSATSSTSKHHLKHWAGRQPQEHHLHEILLYNAYHNKAMEEIKVFKHNYSHVCTRLRLRLTMEDEFPNCVRKWSEYDLTHKCVCVHLCVCVYACVNQKVLGV